MNETQDRLNSYFYNAPDGVFVISDDGKCIDINPAACELIGYEKTQLINTPLFRLIPPHKSFKHPNDKVFHYGGKEFTVALNNTGKPGALQVVQDLRKNIETLQFPRAYSATGKGVTVSIGLVLRTSSCNTDKTTLFGYTDEALYDAKSTGRNRVMMYEIPKE